MRTELNGKVALITGASRGIGKAAARILAGYGVKVVLAARSASEIEQIAAEIGANARAIVCDVASYDDVAKAVDLAKTAFGGLDILVNNAGMIDPVARIAESDPDAWSKVVDVNLKGVYYGVRAALPALQKRGGGVIINISSGAATSALEGWSHYCTTKAAVLMLTKSVHKEYAEEGIRCVGLSPGTVATDMQKVIKVSGVNPVSNLEWSDHIPPEWVGETIAFLATEEGRPFDGGDFSLKSEEGRRAVGLID